MVFEQAWSIVKDVDFRIPRPVDPPAKYTEPNAVLAFAGSKIPMIHTHEQSVGLPISAGRLEVGDFGEDMHEGRDNHSFTSYHHGIQQVMDEIERASLVRAIMEAGIVDERQIEDALDEAAFADMRGEYSVYSPNREREVRDEAAVHNHPLLDAMADAYSEPHFSAKRMSSGKGSMTTRLGGGY